MDSGTRLHARTPQAMHTVRIDTIVIGAGQAGLSVGYYLARRGVPFVILEASERVGDSWRTRWDSLRLFSPARFDSLPGLAFPAPRNSFPTKDEMADYLESYARHFRLPVRTSTRVERLWKENGRYVASAGRARFEADNVIVAMADHQEPRLPSFATELDARVVQLHSRDYRNPSQLAPGGVLLVGAGNSGAEIASELVRAGHTTWLAGREVGQVPFKHASRAARHLIMPLLFRFIFHRVLTVRTPMGRKARAFARTTPLIRIRGEDLAERGVRRVPKMVGVSDGLPRLEDGRTLGVTNVIWCTGYRPNFSWIDLPIFDADGHPKHERGFVAGEPGLAFVGLHFLYAMSSAMIHGVSRDAKRVVDAVASRQRRQA